MLPILQREPLHRRARSVRQVPTERGHSLPIAALDADLSLSSRSVLLIERLHGIAPGSNAASCPPTTVREPAQPSPLFKEAYLSCRGTPSGLRRRHGSNLTIFFAGGR